MEEKYFFIIEKYTNEYKSFKTLSEAEKALDNVEQVIIYASNFDEAYNKAF
jgi:hypothetical protein